MNMSSVLGLVVGALGSEPPNLFAVCTLLIFPAVTFHVQVETLNEVEFQARMRTAVEELFQLLL